MSEAKLTLGKAIDTIIDVLEQLDERSRDTALSAVCTQLGLASPQSDPLQVSASVAGQSQTLAAVEPVQRVTDIRTLRTAKQPTSAKQMACLVAFYLQETAPPSERKGFITAADIDKYFKQAGHKLPAKMAQLLIDLKLAGYMDSVGRGEYKLNAVGYNLVAHGMPAKAE